MKKLMFVAAIAAAMTGLADVEGANVVGYIAGATRPADNYLLRGIQFDGVGKNFTAQDIKIEGGTGPLYTGSFRSVAPQIILRNAAGAYSPADTLYFLADGDYRSATEWYPGWVDAGANLSTKLIDLAQGFWIYDPYNAATASYTITGQVHGDDFQAEYKTADGYDLASNPFPTALNPNADVVWEGMEDAPLYSGNFKQEAPQIIIRNAAGAYSPADTLYFLADGDYRSPTDYDPAWVDANANPVTTAKIPAGAGFWFFKGSKVKGTVKATFKKPIK